MQFRLRTVAVVCAAILFSFVAAVESARAQDITGRMSGTATDNTGAVIVGANVTITNEATGVSLPPLTTNQSGFWVADDLPVGSYSVTITAKGFKTTTLTKNYIAAGSRVTADVTMELGAVTESLTVTANAVATNTTSGEIQTTLSEQQMLDIPLNQRHYEEAVTLIPGAYVQGNGQNAAAIFSGYSNAVAVVNGQRGDGQFWAIDGGFNEDSGSNGSNFNEVGIDFVQELDVQTSNYDAEFGRSASATINVVTRSGGDQYHGTVFEFVQNNDFNARASTTKLTDTNCASGGTPTAYECIKPFHFNDYGWDFGGPVPYLQPKGKLFVFAGQEWRKFRGSATGLQAASETQTFPTFAEDVNHNFADVAGQVTLIVPPGAPAGCTIVANQLSPACITTDGAAIARIYQVAAGALGGVGVGGGNQALPTSATSGNETFSLQNPGNTREDIIRVDEHANDHQSMYFRYLHDFVLVTNPYSTFGSTPEVPVDPDSRHRPGTNLQFGWTDIIGPNLINEFKINADWHSQTTPLVSLVGVSLPGPSWQSASYGLGFIPPLGLPPAFPGGLPIITFGATNVVRGVGPPLDNASNVNGGLTSIQGPGPNFLASPTADINPIDNVTWVKNNHTIKFGVEFARNRKEQNARANSEGQIAFANSSTNSSGLSFADALMGTYNQVSQISSNPVGQFRFNVEDAFAEDTWKFSRKLSIVMGIRFSHTVPTYAQGNNMTQFDPIVGTTGAYLPAAAATYTAFGNGSTISAASKGLCPVVLNTFPATPPGSVYCNGLIRPGGVPADQAGRVQVVQQDPTLLASIPGVAQRGFYLPENLWAPRFGFSYAPFGDKTVIRGGFGIFYDHPEGNVLCGNISCQADIPWAQNTTITALAAGPGLSGNLTAFDVPAGGTIPAPSAIALANNTTVDPRLQVARSYQYSFSVQRELPQDMLLQVAYVGTLGRHVLRDPAITDPAWANQGISPFSPNPNTFQCPAGTNLPAYGCTPGAAPGTNFANAAIQGVQLSPYLGYSTGQQMETGDANSNYNSGQIQLTKRTGFVTTSIAYTFAKYLGMGGGAGDGLNENGEPECPYTCLVSTAYQTSGGAFVAGSNPVMVQPPTGGNGVCSGAGSGFVPVYGGCQVGGTLQSWRQYYYGVVSADARHIISGSFTLTSPWAKNATGLEGLVLRGWSATGIVHFQSGSPDTVTDSVKLGDSKAGAFSVGRRASIVPGQSLYTSCAITTQICWVNTNAFAAETALAAGDAPVGDIRGPSWYQWDMSAQKTFELPWREGMNFQLRGDFINAFNQTEFTNSFKSLTPFNASFGQINSTNPGRIIQVGGKFNF